MAYTQTDLDAIQTAIASGELLVQFADRTVRYRSIDELRRAENRIARALATTRVKQHLVVANKGFAC